MSEPAYFRNTCAETALRIYHNRRPSYTYAIEHVTPLLFMTAAHESGGFRFRRQQGRRYPLRDYIGAYGLVQMERATVEWMLDYLHAREAMLDRVLCALEEWGDYDSRDLVLDKSANLICKALEDPSADALGVILMRLRYFPDPHPIPGDLDGQAEYAKRVYNTHLGAAKPEDYANAYRRLW